MKQQHEGQKPDGIRTPPQSAIPDPKAEEPTVRRPAAVKTERFSKAFKRHLAAVRQWAAPKLAALRSGVVTGANVVRRNAGPAINRAGSSAGRFLRRTWRAYQHKRKHRIRRTDRERVYKLRGYTTMEKVNRLRKIQRRVRLAQRLLITLLCLAVVGYVVLRNNPLTDLTELRRIAGLRDEMSVPFEQYEFELVRVTPPESTEADAEPSGQEPDEGERDEIPDEENLQVRIREEGRSTPLFYVLPFEDYLSFSRMMNECTYRISDEDIMKIAQSEAKGTLLAVITREGNDGRFRFTAVRESGVMLDVSATAIDVDGGSGRIYIIALDTDVSYAHHSIDIEVEWNPS